MNDKKVTYPYVVAQVGSADEFLSAVLTLSRRWQMALQVHLQAGLATELSRALVTAVGLCPRVDVLVFTERGYGLKEIKPDIIEVSFILRKTLHH